MQTFLLFPSGDLYGANILIGQSTLCGGVSDYLTLIICIITVNRMYVLAQDELFEFVLTVSHIYLVK